MTHLDRVTTRMLDLAGINLSVTAQIDPRRLGMMQFASAGADSQAAFLAGMIVACGRDHLTRNMQAAWIGDELRKQYPDGAARELAEWFRHLLATLDPEGETP